MDDLSYNRIQAGDTAEHDACPLKWDCANCTKTLCIHLVAVADFPSLYGHFRILGFTNNKDGKDHTMVGKGDVAGKENILARVHSSCLTGDALGSLRCDCGPQLRRSMVMMEEEGLGILVYMQQE
jgi:3,4-dihydroxy 2-butanone 4-phosphate synthase/GTP cyclohydrolase II